MVKFTTPTNLNGAELMQELKDAGITVSDFPMIDGNGDLHLAIQESDSKKAESIVASHNGNTVPSELTIEEKLASVGLNLTDLKAALGL
jgi:hypothetical protein